jgi:hypothetical protein
MVTWLRELARDRLLPELGATPGERTRRLEEWLADGQHDRYWFMTALDTWKHAPRDEHGTGLVPGVYRRNGTIYVVKQNRTNERLHARRLVEIGGRRLTEADTVVQIEFEYDRDALRLLRPEDQMTLEEARPFIIRYGRCIFCNTELRDARSVERGVGPVCVRRYAPPREPEVTSPEVSSRLAALRASLERR